MSRFLCNSLTMVFCLAALGTGTNVRAEVAPVQVAQCFVTYQVPAGYTWGGYDRAGGEREPGQAFFMGETAYLHGEFDVIDKNGNATHDYAILLRFTPTMGSGGLSVAGSATIEDFYSGAVDTPLVPGNNGAAFDFDMGQISGKLTCNLATWPYAFRRAQSSIIRNDERLPDFGAFTIESSPRPSDFYNEAECYRGSAEAAISDLKALPNFWDESVMTGHRETLSIGTDGSIKWLRDFNEATGQCATAMQCSDGCDPFEPSDTCHPSCECPKPIYKLIPFGNQQSIVRCGDT